ALREGEVVPARLREVVALVRVEIEAARGDLVQQRLPQVRGRAVDERHGTAAPARDAVAQPGGQLQSARPAADDHDMMQARHSSYFCRLHLSARRWKTTADASHLLRQDRCTSVLWSRPWAATSRR